MNALYWRPRKLSRPALGGLALATVAALLCVEMFRQEAPQPWHAEKVAAAERAVRAMRALKHERLRRGHPIAIEFDPAETGLVGDLLTPVTSISGHLQSKQTSVNPNFAAIVVDLLARAGLERGDCVAVGYSGSFPAVNVCVCAALEELRLKPVIVASAAASQFGANFPDFMWIDMERFLYERGHISFHALACSRGGYEDRGLGLTDEARRLIDSAIQRNGLPLIDSASFEAAIDERMALYEQHAAGRPIKAYINVGGGTVSVGRSLGKRMYRPGLNLDAPDGATEIDSVMTRFIKSGTPVLHLVEITQLAEVYGLPAAPTRMPPVGQSTVYSEQRHNRWLAGGLLVLLLAVLSVSCRPDVLSRLFRPRRTSPPESTVAASCRASPVA
ncbi:MAG TPA: poly-gamma-glutamate system protein [Planctomycetaceae bacterium]|nr:poly-gamma-glutamate system protein [Planctomycetaceae bacterium]